MELNTCRRLFLKNPKGGLISSFTLLFIVFLLQFQDSVVNAFIPLCVRNAANDRPLLYSNIIFSNYNRRANPGFKPLPSTMESQDESLSTAGMSSRQQEEDFIVNDLKQKLLDLASRTARGFDQSATDKSTARKYIFELAKYNPTADPARAYYEQNIESNNFNEGDDQLSPCLQGKWTLVYTDAPDITGLDTPANPLVSLGRIGQECDPPFIKNVIEWKRPDWMPAELPLSGPVDSRVFQKVVTVASAAAEKPCQVNLEIAGFQAETDNTDISSNSPPESFLDAVQERGLVAGVLLKQPLDVQGPLKAPFGTFEILYLDEELRIVKTGQNFVAVNRRIPAGEEWF